MVDRVDAEHGVERAGVEREPGTAVRGQDLGAFAQAARGSLRPRHTHKLRVDAGDMAAGLAQMPAP